MCFYETLSLLREKGFFENSISSSKQSDCLAHSRLTLNVCWIDSGIYDALEGLEKKASKYENFKYCVQWRGQGSSMKGIISWIWDGIKK